MASTQRVQTRCPKCREDITVSIPLVRRRGFSRPQIDTEWSEGGEDYIDEQVRTHALKGTASSTPYIVVLVGLALLGGMVFLALQDRNPDNAKREAPSPSAAAASSEAAKPRDTGESRVPEGTAPGDPAAPGEVAGEASGPPTGGGGVDAATLRAAVETGLAFLAAPTWEEAASMVRFPEIVRPRMADYYRRHPWRPHTAVLLSPRFLRSGEMYMTQVEAQGLSGRVFVLEKTPDGFRVDWESFVVYSEADWPDLMKNRPVEPPVEIRARVAETNRESEAFPLNKGFLAFRLTQPHTGHVLFGHIDPAKAERSEALTRIAAGQAGLFTLRIRYPADARTGVEVLIEEVVCPGWTRKG